MRHPALPLMVALCWLACDADAGEAPVTLRSDAVFLVESGPLIINLDQRDSFGILDVAVDADRVAVLFVDGSTGFVDHYTPTGSFQGTSVTGSSAYLLALSDDAGETWTLEDLPAGLPHGTPALVHLWQGRIFFVAFAGPPADVPNELKVSTAAVAEYFPGTRSYSPVLGGVFGGTQLAFDGKLVRRYAQQIDGRAVDVGDPANTLGYYYWQELDLDTGAFVSHQVTYTFAETCYADHVTTNRGASWIGYGQCGKPKVTACLMRAEPRRTFAGDPLPSDGSMRSSPNACVPIATWPASSSSGSRLVLGHADGTFQSFSRDGHAFAARLGAVETAVVTDTPCTSTEDDPFGECPKGLCSQSMDCGLYPEVCGLAEHRCVVFENGAVMHEVHLGAGSLEPGRRGLLRSLSADLHVLRAPDAPDRFVRFAGDAGLVEVPLAASPCTDPDRCGHSSVLAAAVRLSDDSYLTFYSVDRGAKFSNLFFYAIRQAPPEAPVTDPPPPPRPGPLQGCTSPVPAPSPLDDACALASSCFPDGVAVRTCSESWRQVSPAAREAFIDRVTAQGCGALPTIADVYASFNAPSTSPCADTDGDGVADVFEAPGDTDGDGLPDFRDADDDGDGRADEAGVPWPHLPPLDTDGDGVPDHRDTDSDGDGVPDAQDNCPLVPNADQADAGSDGHGDACDLVHLGSGLRDADGDGIADTQDNCPYIANPDQADGDSDGLGDACEGPSLAEAGLAKTACDGDVLVGCDATVDCAELGLACQANPLASIADPFVCGPVVQCPLERMAGGRCQGNLLVYETFGAHRYADCAKLGLVCDDGTQRAHCRAP